jgi:polysaccharide biosynthesis/export protein
MPTSLRVILLSLLLTASASAAQDSGSNRASNSSASSNAPRSESGGAQLSPSAPASTIAGPTDPSYRLNIGDTVYITVGTQSSPGEASTTATIGKRGDVRLTWIDDEIMIDGKTVRDAEHFLENLYKDRELFNRPVASVKVANYFPREVSVNGAVRAPGLVAFLPDTLSMDIAQVIDRVGGFSTIAKANQVMVTHRETNGKETSVTLDLESLMTGRRKPGKDRAEVLIYPGDRIYVPESIF